MPRWGQRQLSAVVQRLGGTFGSRAARLEVSVLSGGGTLAAVTTVVDNVNDDAAAFAARALDSSVPASLGLRPVWARASGTVKSLVPALVNGCRTFPAAAAPFTFRSVMGFTSLTAASALFRLTYYDLASGATIAREVRVPGRKTVEYTNVLEQLFGIGAGVKSQGALFVESDPSGLFWCRVASSLAAGTIGDSFPVVHIPSEGLTGAGVSRVLALDALEQSVDCTRGTRSNLNPQRGRRKARHRPRLPLRGRQPHLSRRRARRLPRPPREAPALHRLLRARPRPGLPLQGPHQRPLHRSFPLRRGSRLGRRHHHRQPHRRHPKRVAGSRRVRGGGSHHRVLSPAPPHPGEPPAGPFRKRDMHLAAGAAALLFALPAAAQPKVHDRAFWTALATKEFAVPEGESAGGLALEAADLLSSPDPTLRDGIGYEALARWVYGAGLVPPADLERLRLKLQAGLKTGLGESTGEAAFGRSFSALGLSILAAADLKRPTFPQEAFDDLLSASIAYLGAEKDLRGFVAGSGWVHATAHTGDVLKFLARNPKLSPAGQARIVAAVAGRLQTAGVVFAWGEDERLALALVSLTRRKDFDPKPFEAWFGAVSAENAALWRNGPAIDPGAFVPVRAQKQALVHLAALLAREEAAPGPFRKTLDTTLGKLAG